MVLGGGALSYERGTPLAMRALWAHSYGFWLRAEGCGLHFAGKEWIRCPKTLVHARRQRSAAWLRCPPPSYPHICAFMVGVLHRPLLPSYMESHGLSSLSSLSTLIYVVPWSEFPIVPSYPHLCNAMVKVPHRPILPTLPTAHPPSSSFVTLDTGLRRPLSLDCKRPFVRPCTKTEPPRTLP